MDNNGLKILVVDDEIMIAQLLATALKYEKWNVEYALDGVSALKIAQTFKPEVAILDVSLPGMNGFELLHELRTLNPEIIILFLTARDSVEDRVAGLTAGGDDYVIKPFSLEEVTARIRALKRRLKYDDEERILTVGDVSLNEETHMVTRFGETQPLTVTEFELLRYFMRNPNRVLSKTQILDRVWHYDFGGQANVVELYVSYLRKKLDTKDSSLIQTIRSVGYIFKPVL